MLTGVALGRRTGDLLNGSVLPMPDPNTQTGQRQQTTTFHITDGERGHAPGFIGIRAYARNTVAWRHVRIKA
jgi:hypothetical protein